MRSCEVRNQDDVVAYLVDCTLATVESMAMIKTRKKGEFERQIGIAQKGCDWMEDLGISPQGTRAEDIIGKCSVKEWAFKRTI